MLSESGLSELGGWVQGPVCSPGDLTLVSRFHCVLFLPFPDSWYLRSKISGKGEWYSNTPDVTLHLSPNFALPCTCHPVWRVAEFFCHSAFPISGVTLVIREKAPFVSVFILSLVIWETYGISWNMILLFWVMEILLCEISFQIFQFFFYTLERKWPKARPHISFLPLEIRWIAKVSKVCLPGTSKDNL